MFQVRGRHRAVLFFAFALGAAGWLVSSCPSAAQVFTDFPLSEGLPKMPKEIAAGRDGVFWFTETAMNRVGLRDATGAYREAAMADSDGVPTGITLGPDGNVWFVTSADRIGFVRGYDVYATTYPLPGTNLGASQMITGPDDRMWFTETTANRIARATTDLDVIEFDIPTANSGPTGIAAGPDGNVWFIETQANAVGRITPDGAIVEYPIPTADSQATHIAAGPDGNLWFGEKGKIGRITPDGVITEFPLPDSGGPAVGIAAGPDGSLWFAAGAPANLIGRIKTSGVVTEWPAPTAGGDPYGVAAGPEGVWFTETAAGRVGLAVPVPMVASTLHADGYVASAGSSNLNGVLEPGESVVLSTGWKNVSRTTVVESGIATDFSGPAGPAYTLQKSTASYGTLVDQQTSHCGSTTRDCYVVSVSGERPVLHWDAVLAETLTYSAVYNTWLVHIGGSFPDVSSLDPFYFDVETILHKGITGGCGGGLFCPQQTLTRAQMAVFLLKAKFGSAHVPVPAGGTLFTDVSAGDFAAAWIEELARLRVTSGCGSGAYCPGAPITRQQMAVMLLRDLYGSAYAPTACTGRFLDVPCSSPYAPWIEDLFVRGIASGCGGSNYCPTAAVTRGQMAAFLARGLQIFPPPYPGPSGTPTQTYTPTFTPTGPTRTATFTPTGGPFPCAIDCPTHTPSMSPTPTVTPTGPTKTPTLTPTFTRTGGPFPCAIDCPTHTPVPSATRTPTP